MTRITLNELHHDDVLGGEAMKSTRGGFFTNPSWSTRTALARSAQLTRRYSTSYSTNRYTVNPYGTARYTVNPYSTWRYSSTPRLFFS